MGISLANSFRVPGLFTFTLGEKGQMQFHASIHTESNVIDLTLLGNQSSVVYSMDTSHQAFSTDALVDTEQSNSRSLVGSVSYCPDSKTWKVNGSLQERLVEAMRGCAQGNLHAPHNKAAKEKPLTELLYGLESLRKRGADNNEAQA